MGDEAVVVQLVGSRIWASGITCPSEQLKKRLGMLAQFLGGLGDNPSLEEKKQIQEKVRKHIKARDAKKRHPLPHLLPGLPNTPGELSEDRFEFAGFREDPPATLDPAIIYKIEGSLVEGVARNNHSGLKKTSASSGRAAGCVELGQLDHNPLLVGLQQMQHMMVQQMRFMGMLQQGALGSGALGSDNQHGLTVGMDGHGQAPSTPLLDLRRNNSPLSGNSGQLALGNDWASGPQGERTTARTPLPDGTPSGPTDQGRVGARREEDAAGAQGRVGAGREGDEGLDDLDAMEAAQVAAATGRERAPRAKAKADDNGKDKDAAKGKDKDTPKDKGKTTAAKRGADCDAAGQQPVKKRPAAAVVNSVSKHGINFADLAVLTPEDASKTEGAYTTKVYNAAMKRAGEKFGKKTQKTREVGRAAYAAAKVAYYSGA